MLIIETNRLFPGNAQQCRHLAKHTVGNLTTKKENRNEWLGQWVHRGL